MYKNVKLIKFTRLKRFRKLTAILKLESDENPSLFLSLSLKLSNERIYKILKRFKDQ